VEQTGEDLTGGSEEEKMRRLTGWLLMAGILGLQACAPKNPYRLSEAGTYDFGTKLEYAFVDTSRGERAVNITVWYPAELPAGAAPSDYNYDAQPDRSEAPYPLILSSAKVGSIFGPHMASHGFVVVGVKGLDYYIPWDENLVDQPLDILFALEQVATTPLEGLEGMIDAGRAGTMGYSFDGYNSLAMSGVRVDPDFYLSQCEQAGSMSPELSDFWIDYYCSPAGNWGEFSEHAGAELTASTDGLWQPMTDERIKAVMPMGPEGAWLFGERGLAFADRPVLILCGTEDVDSDYRRETVYIYEHLGTTDKRLISFAGEEHGMIESEEAVAKMKHFAAAFFGYYLQGNEDFARYFSEDFVKRQEDLAWGVYTEE